MSFQLVGIVYGSVVTPFFTVDWPIVFPFILNAVLPETTFKSLFVVTVAFIVILAPLFPLMDVTDVFVAVLALLLFKLLFVFVILVFSTLLFVVTLFALVTVCTFVFSVLIWVFCVACDEFSIDLCVVACVFWTSGVVVLEILLVCLLDVVVFEVVSAAATDPISSVIITTNRIATW